MATFTSKANGNWSASGQTTWNEVGVPGTGDTVTSFAHNITVDVNTTVGAGSGTAITANSGSGANLTIATGVTLSIRGDISIPSGMVQVITLNHGATYKFLPDASTTLKIDVQGTCHIVCNGTTGDHCIFTTDKVTHGGNNSYINAFNIGGLTTATYTDFSHFGDTTHFGLQTDNFLEATVGDVSITNCTFTDCSYQLTTYAPWTHNFTFSDNICSSSVIQTSSGTGAFLAFSNASPSPGAFTVSGNTFDGLVGISTGVGVSFSNNVFGNGFLASGTWSGIWALFDTNLVVQNGGGGLLSLGGSMSNTYSATTVSGDFHSFELSDVPASLSVTGCVFEHAGGGTGLQLTIGTPSSTQSISVTNNIVLPNNLGGQSGELLTNFAGANPRITMEHNTCFSYGGQFGMLLCGEGAATAGVGTVLSVRGNLNWAVPNDAGNTHNWAGSDFSSSPNTNVISTPGIGYNGYQNPSAGTCTIGGVSTSTPGLNGFIVTNGSITTANDVIANPNFVDSARNFQKWGTTKGLVTPTVADVVAYISNPAHGTPATLIPDLLSYVRAGFRPTSTSFQAASYPTDSSSADAAGNSWPGGAPGIGAMAVFVPASFGGASGMSFGGGPGSGGVTYSRNPHRQTGPLSV